MPLTFAIALLSASMLLGMTAATALSACSNSSMQSGPSSSLPDCRAYEQVSPIEKGGFAAYTRGNTPVQISPNGETIGYLGNEAFPGALGNTALLAAHVSSRSSVGWQTVEQTPEVPEAEVAKAYVVGYDFSGDLSQTVLRVPLVALTEDATPGVYNLFRRRADRTYSLVNAAQPTVSAEEQCPPALMPICFFIADVPSFAGASEDLTHILFETTAQLLVGAPETGLETLYENVDGSVRLVGVLPDGSPAAGGSTAGAGSRVEYTSGEQEADQRVEHAISKDGSRVVFEAAADGGEPDPEQAGTTQVYDRIEGGETIELSAPAQGAAPAVTTPEPASFWAASEDGSRVFFTSNAELTTQSNTGTENNGSDLYECKLVEVAGKPTCALTDVTVDTNPSDATTGPMVQGVVDASSDGSYIYFVALGELVPGKGVDGQPNLYMVHNGGAPTFITTLSSTGSCSFPGKTSADSCDWTPFPVELEAYLTPDGRHLAFMSTMSLSTENFPVGYQNIDQNTEEPDSEVYEYSAPTAPEEEAAETGHLLCISCDPSGAPPMGSSRVGGIAEPQEYKPGAYAYSGLSTPFHRVRALNDTGTRVFYSAPGPLGRPYSQVNEYEQGGEGSCSNAEGCHYVISDPTGGAADQFLGASADGSSAFFSTSSRLVASDMDNLRDVYDARVGGGFAAPPTPLVCENDCRSSNSPSGPPNLLSGSSDPAGNLAAPSAPAPKKPLTRAQKLTKALKSCRTKHSRRKRASCERTARKRYGKKSAAAKRANDNRRAK